MRTLFHSIRVAALFAAAVMLLSGCANGPTAIDAQSANLATTNNEQAKPYNGKIAPYHARFGRSQPVIAVVGDNRSTELSDYVVPYGILSQAQVAEVIALSTSAGPIKTTT